MPLIQSNPAIQQQQSRTQLCSSRRTATVLKMHTHLTLLAICLCLATAVEYKLHPDCSPNQSCDANHQCTSATVCETRWDACSSGYSQLNVSRTVDMDDCITTECATGGCPSGRTEVSSEFCTTFHFEKCFTAGICKTEKCCKPRDQLTCCQLLNCIADYAACQIPAQRSLVDTSASDVYLNKIAHQGRQVFPFYNVTQTQPGQPCSAVRVYGQCTCNDGKNEPGCDAKDSATWYDDTSPTDSPQLLPPGLSQTCIESPLQPPPAPPVPPPPPPSPVPPVPNPPPAPPGQQMSQGKKHMSGGAIAGMVLMMLMMIMMLVMFLMWLFGFTPRALWERVRHQASYQPMFTGQSYAAGLEGPRQKVPWDHLVEAVSKAWTKASQAFQRSKLGRAAQEKGWTGAGSRSYRTYNRDDPEEEEMFTLEDLEQSDRHYVQPLPTGSLPYHTRGLGQHTQHAGDSGGRPPDPTAPAGPRRQFEMQPHNDGSQMPSRRDLPPEDVIQTRQVSLSDDETDPLR